MNNFIKRAEEYKIEGYNNMAVIELATMFKNDASMSTSPLIFFTEDQRKNIIETNKKAVEKMLHIITTGSKWSVDEYMMLLTFITNWRLLENYFDYYKIELKITAPILSFQDHFLVTIKNKENYSNALHAALHLIRNRKNDLNENVLKDIFRSIGLKLSW